MFKRRKLIMEEFKIDFSNLKVDQLGFVYKDIEIQETRKRRKKTQ